MDYPSPHRRGRRGEELDNLPLHFAAQRFGSLLMEIAGDAIIENYVGGLSALDDAIRTLAALNLSTKQVLADAQTGAHPIKITP